MSFERLKNFLAYPDFNKPFDLATGASARGLSAVLSQENRSMTTKNISLPTSSQEPEELFVLESTALSRKKERTAERKCGNHLLATTLYNRNK